MKVYSDSKISINTREEFQEVKLRILNDVCKALDTNPLDESLMADLHWLRREQDHICACHVGGERLLGLHAAFAAVPQH